MDFTVSEKMQTILGMMKEFVQKELIPLEAETLNQANGALVTAYAQRIWWHGTQPDGECTGV
jgi:hypothetical protein